MPTSEAKAELALGVDAGLGRRAKEGRRSYARRLALGAAALVPSALAAVVLPATPSAAAPKNVTISFVAVVAESRCAGFNVAPGDTVTGSYTYDSKTKDTQPDPAIGDDPTTTSGYGFRVDLGSFTAQSDPDAVNFFIEIVNDLSGGDNCMIRSYKNISSGPFIDLISWVLDDPTQKALKNDALPKRAPKLSDWQSPAGLTLENHDGSCFFRANVTSVDTLRNG